VRDRIDVRKREAGEKAGLMEKVRRERERERESFRQANVLALITRDDLAVSRKGERISRFNRSKPSSRKSPKLVQSRGTGKCGLFLFLDEQRFTWEMKKCSRLTISSVMEDGNFLWEITPMRKRDSTTLIVAPRRGRSIYRSSLRYT
jgi:hypothetical protein